MVMGAGEVDAALVKRLNDGQVRRKGNTKRREKRLVGDVDLTVMCVCTCIDWVE